MSTQPCQAICCTQRIASGKFMCKPHWWALPSPLRADINAKWRARRRADMSSVTSAAPFILDHAEACDEAIRWTADGEGKLADFTPAAPRLKRLYAAAGRAPPE